MRIFVLLASLLISTVSVFGQENYRLQGSVEVDLTSPLSWIQRYESELQTLDKRAQSEPAECDVLFFGSSSIRMWATLAEDMAPLRVVNRGYGGATLRDIFYNYERVFAHYKPKAIVLFCDNDISGDSRHDVTVAENIDLYRMIFTRLSKEYPDVPLYFLSIKYTEARKGIRHKQQMLNEMMQEISQRTGLFTYVDVNSLLLDAEGNPDPKYFLADRLHITREAYALWAKELKKMMKFQ